MDKKTLLNVTKLFCLDLDGTTYLGDKPIKDVPKTLTILRKLKKKLVFLTNNSSKTASEYEIKLKKLGLWGEGDFVYTSAMATAQYLKNHYPNKKAYIFARNQVKNEFAINGITHYEKNPDFLVLAYHTELTFNDLKTFDFYLRKGLPFIATHPDDVCPTLDGSMPDVGSIIALFEKSAKRKPDVIIGKPNIHMGLTLAKKTKINITNMCMVGDRMYTDIRFGNNCKMKTILVLSGETSKNDMKNFDDKPDLVLNSLSNLLQP